jgi:pimeloyl-ACP methyl ester carboxylesterase
VDSGVFDVTKRSAEIWQLLPAIAAPVTVVRGVASAVLSAQVVKQMLRVLPNARAAIVDGAGHAVMTDNPAGFAQVVRSFLSDLPVRRQGKL